MIFLFFSSLNISLNKSNNTTINYKSICENLLDGNETLQVNDRGINLFQNVS